MFEEAKRRYLEYLPRLPRPSGGDAITNYNCIMLEIEGIARRHAEEYLRAADSIHACATENSQELRLQKIVETYKLLIVPDSTLQGYLHYLGHEKARQEFRRVAMLIHPDKNAQPHAKVAFQKLYHLFKGVISDSE